MNHKFQTLSDAILAGYVLARGNHEVYRCCPIYSRDTSANHGFGYAFVINTTIPADIMIGDVGPDDACFIDRQVPVDFAASVLVWTNDYDKFRELGSYYVMYTPQDYAAAIEKAHAWIDAYYAENPACAARAAKEEADLAAIDDRHAAKWIGRKIRRQARQAAAAL